MRLVGYTDVLSVRPGDAMRFMVSAEAARYDARLLRLLHGDRDPDGPGFRTRDVPATFAGSHPGRRQEIVAGSCAIVPGLPALDPLGGVSLMFWACPTAPKGAHQVLAALAQDDGEVLRIALDPSGCLGAQLGDARLALAAPLRAGAWYRVALSLEGGVLRLACVPLRPWPGDAVRMGVLDGVAVPAVAPGGRLGFGAAPVPRGIRQGGSYDGKLGGARLLGRALDPATLADAARDPAGQGGAGLLGAWHFGLEPGGARLVDTGPAGLHGGLVNRPTRAVTGPRWSGREDDARRAPDDYDAILFHDDDLDDAGWAADFEWRVPADLPSGIYAAHLRAGEDEDWLPFFVAPPRGGPAADVAFLAPVYSYLAYANEHYMARPDFQAAYRLDIGQVLAGATPYERDVFRYAASRRLNSLYDLHRDGSGVCHASRLRPLATMRPGFNKASLRFGAPHQLNADLYVTDWLEATGVAHDVLTDEILHAEGAAALAPYRVVVTGTHPEYATGPMLDALEGFLRAGGRLMYLGGNGFYWVTSVDGPGGHAIEVRRGPSGTRAWAAAPGECRHATTGERAGLWRDRGRAPQALTGVGFTAQGNDRAHPYRRTAASRDPRAAFVFRGVEAEEFGGFGLHLGGAAGYEIDRADPALGTPPHALVLASSFGHSDAYQHAIEEVLETDGLQGGTVNPLVRADLVFFEHPGGGAVFSVGSISWCGCLSAEGYANPVARITRNVLDRFRDPAPFAAPGDAAGEEQTP